MKLTAPSTKRWQYPFLRLTLYWEVIDAEFSDQWQHFATPHALALFAQKNLLDKIKRVISLFKMRLTVLFCEVDVINNFVTFRQIFKSLTNQLLFKK